MLRGELEAKGSEKGPLAVTGPGGFSEAVKGTAWLRTEGKADPQRSKTRRAG